jgi:hypothetical protein
VARLFLSHPYAIYTQFCGLVNAELVRYPVYLPTYLHYFPVRRAHLEVEYNLCYCMILETQFKYWQ